MVWVLGVVILVLAGFMLYRIIYGGGESVPMHSPMDPLGPCREAFYRSAALEIERQLAILAVSLNEVFEQDQAENSGLATRLISLAESEWRHLDERVLAIQDLMLKYCSLISYAVPVNSAAPRHFRSAIMREHIRAREELSQFVFRPRLRFHIRLGVLRSAGSMLTVEFLRSASQARTGRAELRRHWSVLDLTFHDFDLIAKESLLSLRMVLAALPDELVPEFGAELKAATLRESKVGSIVSHR